MGVPTHNYRGVSVSEDTNRSDARWTLIGEIVEPR